MIKHQIKQPWKDKRVVAGLGMMVAAMYPTNYGRDLSTDLVGYVQEGGTG